jgi:hypothetical protein
MESDKDFWKIELSALFKLTALFLFSIAIFYLLSTSLTSFLDSYWYLLVFFGYVITIILFQVINEKFDSRFLNTLFNIWSFPLAFLYSLLFVGYPFFLYVSILLFYIVVVISIPSVPIYFYENVSKVPLSDGLSTYFIVTTAFIISISFHNFVLEKMVYRLLRVKSSAKISEYKIESVVNYTLNKKNLKFMIYGMYFIYMLYYSFSTIYFGDTFDNDDLNKAILQSFLTVLAYDSLSQNSTGIKLLPSVLFNKFMTTYKNKLDEMEKNNNDSDL